MGYELLVGDHVLFLEVDVDEAYFVVGLEHCAGGEVGGQPEGVEVGGDELAEPEVLERVVVVEELQLVEVLEGELVAEVDEPLVPELEVEEHVQLVRVGADLGEVDLVVGDEREVVGAHVLHVLHQQPAHLECALQGQPARHVLALLGHHVRQNDPIVVVITSQLPPLVARQGEHLQLGVVHALALHGQTHAPRLVLVEGALSEEEHRVEVLGVHERALPVLDLHPHPERHPVAVHREVPE